MLRDQTKYRAALASLMRYNFRADLSDHFNHLPEFLKDMSEWLGSGKLKWRETIDEGVDAAPGAFLKLFKGENLGKMLVKLS